MNDRHLISEHYRLVTELTDSKANIERLVKKYGVYEDDAHALIQRFTKVEARLQNKDIFSYKSLDELEKTISGLETTKSVPQQIKTDADKGAKIVFENENVIVRLIRNKRAAIKFGRGTNWCIAVDDYDFQPRAHWPEDDIEETGNRFNGYTVKSPDENTVYYVERKNPDKDTYDKIAILINNDNEDTEKSNALNNDISGTQNHFGYTAWDFARDNNIPWEVFQHVAYTGEERETIQRIRQQEMDEWMRKERARKK